ncbi:sce7726 family protein [Siminovitchia fordii]|uniref:sce7726 family protein n=1 Tax=Siminovitchia fordii TaxID=254759 RepID=UPI002017D5E0|nr:sce7726 family protein [Siminovitchia fordii]
MILSNHLILNRFFSQSTLVELIDKGSNSVFNTCIDQYLGRDSGACNKLTIENMYGFLRKHYRNEYFYKNTLFNKLLIGRHSLNTTTAITELPIHKSKADFILINGKAVVYEIKTDLDSFDRLKHQINDYYKAFPLVYLVTSEGNELKAKEILSGSNTGLIILTKRNTLSERKPAVTDFSLFDKKVMFNILRKEEFEEIIKKVYGFLPDVTPVFYYRECFALLEQIEMKKLYELIIMTLKKRNQVEVQEYLNYVPYELRFLVYFSKSIQKKYKELNEFLNK